MSTKLGQMQFTRTILVAYSSAAARVGWTTLPLAVQCAARGIRVSR
ncbi:MAG: hypothetical protein IPM22_16910 [Betaproteobacteria bacterium]|nr:hypothetical protein [Betaproteobacteria bacterium]MCC7217967.1 hypothetical protein [Burkholderiales bacterium]